MSRLFWELATSDVALAIVAALLVACFVLSRLKVVAFIPQLAPYTVLAGFLVYLLLADLALCIGFRIADERAQLNQLRIELAWRDNELEQQKATAEDADRIAREKAAEAEELKGKVSDYEDRLAALPPGNCALDDADLDGLRAFSRRARKR